MHRGKRLGLLAALLVVTGMLISASALAAGSDGAPVTAKASALSKRQIIKLIKKEAKKHRGPQGAPGAPGAPGATGPVGPAGPSATATGQLTKISFLGDVGAPSTTVY